MTEQQCAARYARDLIEAGLDPLVTISPEGKITDVNEATVKVQPPLLVFASGSVCGTALSDYFIASRPEPLPNDRCLAASPTPR